MFFFYHWTFTSHKLDENIEMRGMGLVEVLHAAGFQ